MTSQQMCKKLGLTAVAMPILAVTIVLVLSKTASAACTADSTTCCVTLSSGAFVGWHTGRCNEADCFGGWQRYCRAQSGENAAADECTSSCTPDPPDEGGN